MADEFKGLNKETAEIAVSIKNSMREIGISTQALDKQLQKSKGYLIDINDEYKNITQSTNQVVKLQQEAQKSNKATEKAIIEQNKQLNISKTLNIQIDGLYEAALKATGKTQENLFKQAKNLEAARDNSDKLANTFGNIAEDSSKLDKSTIWFGALSEVIKDIPGLRVFSKPFEKASEAARQQVINNAKIKAGATDLGKIQSSGIAGLTAGFKALGPVISSAFAPLAIFNALVKIFNFFLDAMIAADKRVTDIAKNLSIGKDAAAGIYTNLTNLKGTLETELGTTKNIVEAFSELSQLSDFVVIATDKQIDAQIILTKELGVSKEAALGFQETLAVSNIEANKGVDIVYDQIAAFANQNKIVADGRKIFDQIAKTSKLIQLNFKGNFKELVNATLQASKLGLSLDQVNKIGESLLDFEQSISSELEAELLTGKNINLEKARLFALNNDIAGLTQEIANQGITATNFASMNRIQQEAIAKALGMSASELGDSLYKQELIAKVAGNYTNRLREEAMLLKKSNNAREVAKGIQLEQQAIAIEQGIAAGKTFEEAQRSLDAQTKFNNALERAQEIFSDVVTGGLLDRLVSLIETLVDTLEGAGGRESRATRTYSNITSSENYKTLTSTQKEAINELNKIASDQVGFFERFFTSALPFGSTISTLKDIQAKSALKAISEIEKNNTNSEIKPIAEDFISRPGQPIQKFRKDDIIIGGTSLSNGNNDNEIKTLLQELITAVKSGGDVYLDSTKVGTAMAMGTYKVQ